MVSFILTSVSCTMLLRRESRREPLIVPYQVLEMEDAHTCLLELSEDKEASFFAVFDGHGGHDVAKVASSNLHKTIVNNKSYRE